MSLTRQQKEEIVQHMQTAVSEATSVVFMSFDGLTLEDMNTLRDKLFEAGCSLRVIPKRLLRLAMQQSSLAFDPTEHDGQIAVAWGSDAVSPSKVVFEFAKENEAIQIRAGVLEGDIVGLEQVNALAKLPTREQLLGQVVSVMAGPMRGFVGVLSGVPRATVYVLSAIKDSKNS